MEEIIIVSKTKMKDNRVCIGGVTKDGVLVRLLDEDGYNHLDTVDFEIGQVYDIEFENRQNIIPPHVEDILVKSKNFKETNSIKLWLIAKKVKIWRGNADNLFDEKLEWDVNRGTSKNFLKGYISIDDLPINSVGFWISDRDLYLQSNYGKDKYNYSSNDNIFQIPYVGVDNPIKKIPKGTIIRVSLARWWSKDIEIEERCYLQLSGFYL
jgi:hypothetical protein